MQKNNHLTLNVKQNQAYSYITNGKNIFLTGPAGVGKTSIIKLYKSIHNNKKTQDFTLSIFHYQMICLMPWRTRSAHLSISTTTKRWWTSSRAASEQNSWINGIHKIHCIIVWFVVKIGLKLHKILHLNTSTTPQTS